MFVYFVVDFNRRSFFHSLINVIHFFISVRTIRIYRDTNDYKLNADFDGTIFLLLPINFSEIVSQQQTRCRPLLAAAVFS